MITRCMYYIVFFLSLAVTLNVSANFINLEPSLVVTRDLQPHNPMIFLNNLYMQITSTCKVKTEDPNSDIYVEVLNKKVNINGNDLLEGQNESLIVHDEDVLILSVDPLARVKLTNMGAHVISVTCRLF